ncbi:MAG: hypothetical protein ACE5E8_03155, partial [Acidimicrobiia bacterium]
ELTAVAPQPPPLPAAPYARPARRRRVVAVAVAAALWVAVLGVGALLVTQIRFGGDDSAALTTTTAAAAATTTTAAAPTTTAADLDEACDRLIDMLAAAFATPPATPDEITAAYDLISAGLADIARISGSGEVAKQVDEVLDAVGRGPGAYSEVVAGMERLAEMLGGVGAAGCEGLTAGL